MTTRRIYVIEHAGRHVVACQVGPYIQCPDHECHRQFRTMKNLLAHLDQHVEESRDRHQQDPEVRLRAVPTVRP